MNFAFKQKLFVFFFVEMINQSYEHSPSDAGAVLKVERPFYEQHQFNNALDYKSKKDEKPVCSNPLFCLENFNPVSILRSMIPILSWLPRYNVKQDLISDLISGFTVGIMHIPQGTFQCSFFLLIFNLELWNNQIFV